MKQTLPTASTRSICRILGVARSALASTPACRTAALGTVPIRRQQGAFTVQRRLDLLRAVPFRCLRGR